MNKNYFVFFINVLKAHAFKELMGLFFTLLYTFSILVVPFISKYLIDNVLVMKDFTELPLWLLLFFLSCMLQPISSYIKNHIFFYIAEKITFSVRNDMLERLLSATMSVLDKIPSGLAISRVLNDAQNISEFISNIFIVVIKNIFLSFIVLTAMFILSWQISLLIIILLVFYISCIFYLSKKVEKISKNKLMENDVLCQSISESLININLIKVNNLTKFWVCKNLYVLKKIYKNNLSSNRIKNIFEFSSNVIIAISLSIIYGLGAVLIIQDLMSLGTIFALSLYFQILVQPVYELTSNVIQFRDIIPNLKRLDEYLSLEKETEHIKTNRLNLISKDMNSLCINNLDFSYVKGNKKISVLKSINLKFEGNGFYGLIGASGSGKTTLIKMILGLYSPCKGSIELNVNGLQLLSVYAWRNNISYVSQDLEFFNSSILENLKLFNKNIDDNSVIEICKKLNLDNTIKHLPLGYNDIVNEKINLSGGEKQRLCIARALLKKAPIYIFDEPTSALDAKSAAIVCSLIKELAQSSIVIFITHDISLLKQAKNIIMLDNGQIIYSGKYKNLINNSNISNSSQCTFSI